MFQFHAPQSHCNCFIVISLSLYCNSFNFDTSQFTFILQCKNFTFITHNMLVCSFKFLLSLCLISVCCRALWQIGFVVSSTSLNREVQPLFVQPIKETLLEPVFSVTGFSQQSYQLYGLTYSGYEVFRRSFAFTVTFTESVYQADWPMIELEISRQWCGLHGN